jgi:ubiquinone/menaquinone biosynthesis C-methylase UbiE
VEGCAEAATSTLLSSAKDEERLPLNDACIDIALVNSIFNLNPARKSIFRELARVPHPAKILKG